MDLLEVQDLYEGRMGYYENIQLKTMGDRRGEDRKPNYVACSA